MLPAGTLILQLEGLTFLPIRSLAAAAAFSAKDDTTLDADAEITPDMRVEEAKTETMAKPAADPALAAMAELMAAFFFHR